MYCKRRNGIGLIWAMVVLTVLCGIASLSVDYARVQVVKTQLRIAADSAARAAANDMYDDLNKATSSAAKYAKLNAADGKAITLNTAEDIEFGKWDTSTRTFQKLSSSNKAGMNAVRVIARRVARRGAAVPLMLASVLGRNGCDVSAESIMLVTPPVNVNQGIPGTANPFLAGMPAGSMASRNNPHNNPDYAGTASNPKQSPLVVNLSFKEGDSLTFDSIDGTAGHDPNLADFQPDGELTDIGRNSNGSENGISDLKAPINALVGVFLGPDQPNTTSAPSSLDFTSDTSRDFSSLSPKLKQLFFIGDGRNAAGGTQEFIVPKGATRLFLATWDFFEWNNNYGTRTVKIIRPIKIVTVK